MKTPILGALLVGCALSGLLSVAACGGAPAQDPTTMAQSGSAGGASADGAALYAANCASCHGDSKKHSSAAEIHKAIDENLGKMGSLKSLTAPQIDAIAAP
jgi:mono/diheme cytochrome c family protein